MNWCFCTGDRLEAVSPAWKYQPAAKACCRWPFPPLILLYRLPQHSRQHLFPFAFAIALSFPPPTITKSSPHLLAPLFLCPQTMSQPAAWYKITQNGKFCPELGCPFLQIPCGYSVVWSIATSFSVPFVVWQIGHFTVGSVKAYEYLMGPSCWWACVLTPLSYLVRMPELYFVPPSSCPQERDGRGGRGGMRVGGAVKP